MKEVVIAGYLRTSACVGGGQGVAVIMERETYDW